jgi:hypothetical protein
MTGWTGHVAVLPAQATWHGHGNGASSVNGQRIWRRPSQTKADTAMYEDEDDDRFEAALSECLINGRVGRGAGSSGRLPGLAGPCRLELGSLSACS